ncbi:MAG: CRISPR-associated protein Cas4 [Planctomycetia bacterium]|nr:CRISPR-associated protein Cas4 [Planctomycetia bacterium]
MTEYPESEYLLLSGIQHFAFCRRQWALIHIEQLWEENLRTVEGRILHERAHDKFAVEKRGEVVISRGMPIRSREMGVSGECDVVEFHRSPDGIPIHGREGLWRVVPVEYKKGKPKADDVDILQLTAQSVCLEEMFCCEIPHGYLFYGETRHRTEVVFTQALRDKVRSLFQEMHQYYQRRHTPKARRTKACNACSLKDLCLSKLCGNVSVEKYIEEQLREQE